MEIIPDVHQVKIPSPYKSEEYVNVYLLKGEEGNILIDAGYDTPEALPTLKAELGGNNLFKDINYIIVTHAHFDHYGLAAKLKEITGAKLILHEFERDTINFRWVNFNSFMRRVEYHLRQHGASDEDLADFLRVLSSQRQFVVPILPDKTLKGGEIFPFAPFEFKVLLTPGHSPGHICLHELERKLLFSGDLILAEGVPIIAALPGYGENPLGDFITSLLPLSDLEISLVLPGHGLIFTELKQRVQQVLCHIEGKKKAVAEAVKKAELRTAYQVAREVLLKENRTSTWEDISSVRKATTLLETISYLQLLLDEGKVEKFIEHDRIFYESH